MLKSKNLKKEIIRLQQLANTDELTGIYNRRKFSECLHCQLKQKNSSGGILMFDIDDFKRINDDFGHYVGDKVLKSISSVINSFLGKISTDKRVCFSRWGGEEFLILFPQITIDKIINIAENLRKIIATTVFDSIENITVSIGIAMVKKEDTMDSVIIRADDAVYRAKHNGKNRVEE